MRQPRKDEPFAEVAKVHATSEPLCFGPESLLLRKSLVDQIKPISNLTLLAPHRKVTGFLFRLSSMSFVLIRRTHFHVEQAVLSFGNFNTKNKPQF